MVEVAALEVGAEDGGAEGRAGGLLDQVRGREEGAAAVYMFGEPAEKRREVAPGDARQDVGHGACCGVEDLRGRERAQRRDQASRGESASERRRPWSVSP